MNAIKAEWVKIKAELSNKRMQNIFVLVVFIAVYLYNILSKKFMFDAGAYDRLMLATIFQNLIIIKSIMGALSYPFVELDKQYNQNGQFYNYTLMKQLVETVLSLRIFFKSVFSAFILTGLIYLTTASTGLYCDISNYFILFITMMIGQLSLYGVGMVISAIFIMFNINRTIIGIVNLILLMVFMFVNTHNNLVPFMAAKFIIFDTLYAEIVGGLAKDINIGSFIIVLVNSIFYFVLGYISILIARIKLASSNFKLLANE